MKNILYLIIFSFTICISFGQETHTQIKVEIKDSLLFINGEFVHPDSTINFFNSYFGKPNRKKKGLWYKWREYIYDDLGISIMTHPNSVSISFRYKSIIRSQPKSQFQDNIIINDQLIKLDYSFKEIEQLLKPYKFSNIHNRVLMGTFFSFDKHLGDSHLSEIKYYFNSDAERRLNP